MLGIDVGGTAIKAEVLGGDLSPLAATSAPTPHGVPRPVAAREDPVVAAVIGVASRLLESTGAAVQGVGLAVPGLVDAEQGVVRHAANLGWRDVAVGAEVSAALGLPVTLTHDVGAAGRVEWRLGAGRGTDDLLVVIIGTGIAAAIVANGSWVRGSGHAGELGHLIVRPGGPRCACGQQGCLEMISSSRAIAAAYRQRSGKPATGAAEVVRRLAADPAAATVWADATDALADALLAACTILAPRRIVLGGGLSEAGDALIQPVRERMRQQARVAAIPNIVPAAYGARAGVVGAALAALGSAPPTGAEQ